MDKCHPVVMRKNLDLVNHFRVNGIDFIAVPVRDKDHKKELAHISLAILEELAEECDE